MALERAVLGMTLDGQPINPLQGAASDSIEADKIFADMGKVAKWHPAVTKHFRVECGLETLHDFISTSRAQTTGLTSRRSRTVPPRCRM